MSENNGPTDAFHLKCPACDAAIDLFPQPARFWTASEHEAPPQEKPFWAWLHQTGIRKMIWEPKLFEDGGGYVLDEGDRDDEYEPDFWAPLDAIPDPAVQFAHLREAAA